MKTQQIGQIIRDYLLTKETQYSLMINGTWGSGKTFLWKNQLIGIVELSGLKPMHVSLNGINNIDKLEQLLFIQLLPKLGESENDIIRNLTTVSTNLANAASKFFFKSNLTDIAKGTSVKAFNFNKYCICFDDLERCKIPIDELFGYLADFVEHKHLKCIILADEPKVKEHQMNRNLINGYDSIKEKIVGRILNYEPALEEVVPELLKTYSNKKEFYAFLKDKKKFIISIFKEQKIENLRIIYFYLESLSKVHPFLKKEDEAFVMECIFFTAVLSIEFKKGALSSEDTYNFKDLENIDEGWYSRITSNFLSRQDKDIPREKSYAELFYEKYLNNHIEHYHFYPSLYQFILSGFLNEKKLKSELERRKPEEVPEHIAAFRQLLNYRFRELEDEAFAILARQVLKNAESGKYWLYDYKQIANFYFYFSEKGLIDFSKDRVENILISGVSEAGKRKDINQYTYDSMRHFDNDNSATEVIVKEIMRIHREIQIEMENKDSQKILSLIKEGNKEKIATFFQDNKLKKELLPYLTSSDFLHVLVNAPNEIIFLIAEIFSDRYNYNNPGEFMAGDLDFLKDFKKSLKNYLKEGSKGLGRVRKYNFIELQKNVESSIIKIKRTLKTNL